MEIKFDLDNERAQRFKEEDNRLTDKYSILHKNLEASYRLSKARLVKQQEEERASLLLKILSE